MTTSKPLTETYTNPSARTYTCPAPTNAHDVLRFHKTLPHYARTPLVALPQSLSAALGLAQIHVKDESHRFGLPSFKILGASWAIHRALCAALHLDATSTTLAALAPAAQAAALRLVSCTDGNWGRALAHTARLLGVRAAVHVPANIDEATRARIAGEGADVRVVQGDYDASIAAARADAEATGALLVLDTSWPGYEEVPGWVAEGYESMLAEVDEALEGGQPDLVIVSVGVGSWAHAVVAHYKSLPVSSLHPGDSAPAPRPLVATVEPTSASSLLTSLHNGCITPISTGDTIMCGMNCGTTSTIAWPLLKGGVDFALTVSDWEAHEAVQELEKCGINAGPCGAAPFAALNKFMRNSVSEHKKLIGNIAKVVLFCTEGERGYNIPKRDAS